MHARWKHWSVAALVAVAVTSAVIAAAFLWPGVYICATEFARHQFGLLATLRIIAVIDAHNGFVSAIAAVFVAIFTFTLWRTGSAQLSAIQDQIRLAREEFASTHRPKLVVRRISLDSFGRGQVATVQFVVANVGDTAGTILESNATVQIYRNGGLAPQIPDYSDGTTSMGTPTVKPGPGLPIKITSDFPITEELYKAVYPDAGFISGSLYLIGYIDYVGWDGVIRHYAFGRRFDPHSHRFAIMDDPNYEYGG